MRIINQGHLGYCTNIHAGESWQEVFKSLQEHCPPLKHVLSPQAPFGIGLRLSNRASVELLEEDRLKAFSNWLEQNGLYVFTMNGFPYGNFHGSKVKDQVHTPDWTTPERLAYTKRLFTILAALLPGGMEGGVSTSPLSYKYWHNAGAARESVRQTSMQHMVTLVAYLVRIKQESGCCMHLDIEPEPDGMLETCEEYITFFRDHLLEDGAIQLAKDLGVTAAEAQDHIRLHIQLCYDVCHFAVGFEKPQDVIESLARHGLLTGKIQISAALKCSAGSNVPVNTQQACLETFDEPVYLHQAVVKTRDGELHRYRDLGEGIRAMGRPDFEEIRTHFHVPVFTPGFRLLTSTQDEISDVLQLWRTTPFTAHLEVETYTWDVLPGELRTGMTRSIERELQWVLDSLAGPK